MPPSVIEPGTTASRIPATTEFLRANIPFEKPVGVDRESKTVRGLVAAELGIFKDRRGQFDSESLDQIVQLGRAESKGLKSRKGHPGLSADASGTALGRAKNWRRDGDKVRYDLHIGKPALKPPTTGGTPHGEWLMDQCEDDAGLIGSSLVLSVEQIQFLDEHGRPKKDADGNPIPPIWRPKTLRAVDIVDDPAAVRGDALGIEEFDLSEIGDIGDAAVRQAFALLDAKFAGCDRETVSARVDGFKANYLDFKYGPADGLSEDDTMPPTPEELAAGTTNPPKPPAPKPPTNPTPPTPKPGEPGGPPVPTQPRERSLAAGEPMVGVGLSAQELAEAKETLAALKAEREAFSADVKAAREAQRLAIQAETRKRIDAELDAMLSVGKVEPWEMDESDPDTAALSIRQELYRLSTEATERVGDKTLSPLDLKLNQIKSRPVRPVAQQLRGHAAKADEGELSAAEQAALLKHYDFAPKPVTAN